jgi:hypothetical protein
LINIKVKNILNSDGVKVNTKNVESKTFKNIQYEEYKVPDALDYMYVPDFFSSDYNTHPVFEKEEVRVIGTKNEEEKLYEYYQLQATIEMLQEDYNFLQFKTEVIDAIKEEKKIKVKKYMQKAIEFGTIQE